MKRKYVGLEAIEQSSAQGDNDPHREWRDLVVRAMRRDQGLSETDLERIAEHYWECQECNALYQHRYVSVFMHMDAGSATIQIAIGGFTWRRTVQATKTLATRLLRLTDWIANQESLRQKPGLEYYALEKLLTRFVRQRLAQQSRRAKGEDLSGPECPGDDTEPGTSRVGLSRGEQTKYCHCTPLDEESSDKST